VLIGNVDVNLLCGADQDAVRKEINRCLEEGGNTMFMLSPQTASLKG